MGINEAEFIQRDAKLTPNGKANQMNTKADKNELKKQKENTALISLYSSPSVL